MPISRAAAEIEPVRAMRSTSSALPGPIAAADLPSTRSVNPLYRLISLRHAFDFDPAEPFYVPRAGPLVGERHERDRALAVAQRLAVAFVGD